MSYSLLRAALFSLPPETSHDLSLDWLSALNRLGLVSPFMPEIALDPVTIMGIEFPNRVGLAAGLDKNAEHIDGLAAMGFGFIEVGTVTPRPQPGNPKPRMFRLKEQQAIINRMGFNNKGIDNLLAKAAKRNFTGPLGINIGKNFDTPVEKANDDYLIGLRKAYPNADYISVNVSSPNTPGLRSLQFGDSLKQLLDALKTEQLRLQNEYKRYVPVAVKVAPDMNDDEIGLVSASLLEFELDGVIAGNTTLDRTNVVGSPYANEAGGLSGAPLLDKSNHVIGRFSSELGGKIPIIGVGGITEGEHAVQKIKAGASLVQIYSGLIYKGPKLVRDCVEAIRFGV
ncbi:dihydroorotate dehydrogenase [Oleiphilus sp. HI0071]|uniref:quinone-dependent dihydroorotate dehydrogenase n=1 Tax=unclassified Oleiphilus TaxID=2631174 RepID=UPI0007C2A1BF|nr:MULTISPECIES: quinone-dependent dihydroorotate dehydrogenase [unclassified Oleiphilus]KZY72165.1 dihydroorotate dehydrogenase [Oleiphilus sp. HI0065]KZY86789.1 dihydroorotate dehydrogenase [Oleiphilus sp. HI0071]KZY91692.1 dihydroorotate dehydrogenase [Oleiphilus sp. HI0073]KZZ54919.1 dihydroorotate dehydrogenase [Oleiphilus sp. HI0118]KZZ61880.1 dihydroorotate dehydrogenase [Oleiphilus sp. HI0122]KZZ64277.1 dihydroorotate dehydrogenase [Oleiphilus sp. HI0130]KZZ75026.1 dihydroorotate deh